VNPARVAKNNFFKESKMIKKEIQGQKISRVETIDSMYAMGNLEVSVRGNWNYRINVKEILKMIKLFNFDIDKKKKYTYLINPKRRRRNE
jgi:hypothetical protein